MINILIGLLRMKLVAVLLGPAGVGLLGFYQNLIQMAALASALGITSSGTRQIAAARAEGSEAAVDRTRRALLWATLVLALAGAALFWLASSWIARNLLNAPELESQVAWLSLGVALTVASGSQSALLAGLRRVGDLARVQVGSGVLGAAFGVLALWLWGAQGLLVMILAAPAVAFALGHFYVSRIDPPAGPRTPFPEVTREWRALVRLGLAFMVSGLVTALGHLAVRTLVQREMGADALGQFHAAWTIGMTYLGFVLGAMAADYYPRLTGAINDHAAAVQLVNEQTEVALLLCAPVLLVLLGLAPWVIQLLYSAEFAPAVEILRWQLLGDILKVMSWPLGFIILASGAGKTFVATETLGIGVFVLGVFIGLPLIGVVATGVAFLALYAVHLPLVWWLGGRMIGFRWTRAVRWQAVMVIGAAAVVELACRQSDVAGATAGGLLGSAAAVWAVLRLSERAEATGRLGRIGRIVTTVQAWKAKRT